jgi:hypothetical protein
MNISRTITTFIITALIGVFTFIFAAPKKVLKSKAPYSKSRNESDDKDDLFI